MIAFSTMSQLGLMVVSIGLSCYSLALFHLVNHAFYKALLFLGAGSVIHSVSDNQDFRRYGGLLKALPLTYTVMLIASLSLTAFPFMAGFYSKDFILESSYGQFTYSGLAVYFLAIIGASFTTLYSVKVLVLTFVSNPNGPIANYNGAHEGNIFMSLPLIILAVCSIFFGYISKDLFIGLGTGLFTDNSLFIHPLHENTVSTEFYVPTVAKILPFIASVSLSIIALICIEVKPKALTVFKSSRFGYNIFSFFSLKALMEVVYNKFITRTILSLGGTFTKILDRGAVETLGPYGLERGLLVISSVLSTLSTAVVTTYALYILMGAIFYLVLPSITMTDSSLVLAFLFNFAIINLKQS